MNVVVGFERLRGCFVSHSPISSHLHHSNSLSPTECGVNVQRSGDMDIGGVGMSVLVVF